MGQQIREANLQRALLMRSLYVGSQSDMSEDDQVGEFRSLCAWVFVCGPG